MTNILDKLIYDIAVRFPRDRIVYRGSVEDPGYYMLEGNTFTKRVDSELIDLLIEKGFAYKNNHLGLVITSKLLS